MRPRIHGRHDIGLISVIIILCFFAMSISISRALINIGAISAVRYASVILFTFITFYATRSFSGDRIAIIGFAIFIVFTIIFSILSNPDLISLLHAVGLIILLLLYSLNSSDNSQEIAPYIILAAGIFGTIFSYWNALYIFSLEAYTLNKFQFSGAIDNPNAFGNLAGFMFIFIVGAIISIKNVWYRIIIVPSAILLLVQILLSFSRATLLSLVLSIGMYLTIKKPKIAVYSFVWITVIIILLLIALPYIDFHIPIRDPFETTGRGSLLSVYIERINSLPIFVGTGTSENSLRLKRELGYFDVLLYSGIGFIGFAVFWMTAIYYALYSINKESFFAPGIAVIYVIILGIFEGYLANVASIITIMSYVSAGMCFQNWKRYQI